MSTNISDIVKLNLNDTFYDWYLRTNQIIDYVNPINVYDVFAGNGLVESRTGTPGTIELSVDTSPALYGITTIVDTNDGSSVVALDFSSLTNGTVVNTSIFSFQDSSSQLYKVEASDILPPDLNGDHTFNGAITVADLTVSDGNITLITDSSTNLNNAGLFVSGAETETVFFTYNSEDSAWYSSHNYGLVAGMGFVTDSTGDAIYPFIASETQAQIDLRLQSSVTGIPERFSVFAEFDATNTLTFSHYSNGSLVSDILELTSTGTNGSSVVVKDTITITDVLNSTPFTQSPTVQSVPVTDSTDGFLNDFVNRVKLVNNGASAGDFVYVNASGEATPTDPASLNSTYQIGIVESVDGSDVIVILSGSFDGLLSGLTTGDIYYLSLTPGEVTNVNPASDTDGTIGKPAFIATSATSGILIPDFTDLGGGGGITIIGGSGLSNAFSNIIVNNEVGSTLQAYVASGADTIILQEGSNITFTTGTSPDKITISATSNVPDPTTGDAYSVLSSDSTSSFVYSAVGEYSVVGRVTTSEIDSIQLTQGTILGRGPSGSDNGVEALDSTTVLDILGFSGNSFLKNVIFEDSAGATTYAYPDTDDGETLTIRAGDNIFFEKIGNIFYISSTGATTDTVVSGGGSLQIAVEGSFYSTIEQLVFGNGDDSSAGDFIEFSLIKPTGTTGTLYAKPSSAYLPITTDTDSGNHIAGNTLRILGDGLGITTNYGTDGTTETLTVNLSPTIEIGNINARSDGRFLTLNIAGRETAGNRSFIFRDEEQATRTLDSTSASNSQVIIKAWDNISTFNSASRLTTTGQHDYCVSMVADTTTVVGGSTYTLPFKFYEILVDRLTVENLDVTTAAKQTEYLGSVIGYYNQYSGTTTLDTEIVDANVVRYRTDTTDLTSPTGTDGIILGFYDDAGYQSSGPDLANPDNWAYIFKPSSNFIENDLSGVFPYRTFIIDEGISFGNAAVGNEFSPVLSRGGANTINISNLAGSVTELSFTANDTGTLDIGIQSGTTNDYSYFNHNDGTNDYYLRLSTDSILKTDSLILLNNTDGGFTINISDFTSSDTGKIMMITSVNPDGMATIEPTYVIKPYNNGTTVATDPINTLYYVV